jgi:hypothetical protein
MAVEQASKIAELNDAFRRSGFGMTITVGVQGLEDVAGLLQEVRVFDAFTEDNDPYGEHDFGSIVWQGEKVFWKIDYYDQRLEYGEEPLSPNCRRILTVMLASEY